MAATILIVDDDQSMRDLLRLHLSAAGYEVLVEGDTIKEVSAKPIKASKATVINCGKRTLMPGLIDCHVHLGGRADHKDPIYGFKDTMFDSAFAAVKNAKTTLDAGFTTVRIELFVADPVAVQGQALAAGATEHSPVEEHTHETTGPRPVSRMLQGAVVDPFGHLWLIGKFLE